MKKDYYQILGVDRNSSLSDIKKSYRKLVFKYHPDKNPNNIGYEEKFKKIVDAYENLKKLKENSFYEATNIPPNNKNLSIEFNKKATLIELIAGKYFELKYTKIKYDIHDTPKKEEKNVKFKVCLLEKWFEVIEEDNKKLIRISIQNLGDEKIVHFKNMLEELEKIHLYGDLVINIEIENNEGIYIKKNNIIQILKIPLYKVLDPTEKVEIQTIFNKKYEANINNPNSLTDLKVILKQQGIMNNSGNKGDYIIKFDPILPKISKLSRVDKKNLLKILKDI